MTCTSMTSSRAKPLAKVQGFTCLSCLLLLLSMLPGCQQQVRPASAASDLSVLEIAEAVYAPAQGTRASAGEEAMCSAWSLDAGQAESFFRLSNPLSEGELHDYDWLPCSISGRVRAQDALWDFEINAAGTSTWRNGDEVRQLGCSQAACEPFVILMPGESGP